MRCVLLSLAFLLCTGAALARPGWRVINGTEPRLYEFPSMVSIWLNNMHYCGGTLINADTVLTAAHCFFRVNPSRVYNFHVRINAHNFRRPTALERRVKVTRVRCEGELRKTKSSLSFPPPLYESRIQFNFSPYLHVLPKLPFRFMHETSIKIILEF